MPLSFEFYNSEIKQLNSTVSVTVTKPWQVPLSVTANTYKITVHPPDAELHVIGVTTKRLPVINYEFPGCIIKFENSIIQQLPYKAVGAPRITVVSKYTYAQLRPGDEIKIIYDDKTGHLIANVPCYAFVLVHPFTTRLAEYSFDVSTTTNYSDGPAVAGMAWIEYVPPTVPKGLPPDVKQVASCEIPLGGVHRYERYRVCIPTVVTDVGEYHKPLDFDKDSYNPAHAYGGGGVGPSKDYGYVIKDVPIEIGYMSYNNFFAVTYPKPYLLGMQKCKLIAYINTVPKYSPNGTTMGAQYTKGTDWALNAVQRYQGFSPTGLEIVDRNKVQSPASGEGLWS